MYIRLLFVEIRAEMAEAFNDNGRPKGREEVEEAMDGKEEVKKNRTASTCMGGGADFSPYSGPIDPAISRAPFCHPRLSPSSF